MTIWGWISGIKKISVPFLQGQWLGQDSINIIFWRTYCYCKSCSVITVGWIVVVGIGCIWRTPITTTGNDSKTKKQYRKNE